MSDQTPTTPAPQEPPPAPAAEAAPAKAPRPRPSWAQVGVATGALVGVLAIAGIGFAIGRATVDDRDLGFRPGQEQRFDQRGPGGPGMMPPALPPNRQDDQDAPSDQDDS
jgi:hypothetical protein